MLTHVTLTFFFFNDTATTEIYTLSLHDALPISARGAREACRHAAREPGRVRQRRGGGPRDGATARDVDEHVLARGRGAEEHTTELQSLAYFVCRLLLEKKKTRSRSQRFRPSAVC